MKRLTIALVASASLAALAPAHAEIVATQHVERDVVVEGPDGRPQLERVAASTVAPGEELIYALRYENSDAEPAEDVVLVMAVPREVDYVEGSIAGDDAAVSFSADGGQTYVARGRLTVVEDGTARPARGDDITHIRWTLARPLAPGAKGAIAYRAVLK